MIKEVFIHGYAPSAGKAGILTRRDLLVFPEIPKGLRGTSNNSSFPRRRESSILKQMINQ
jgi:hypothetical protein